MTVHYFSDFTQNEVENWLNERHVSNVLANWILIKYHQMTSEINSKGSF